MKKILLSVLICISSVLLLDIKVHAQTYVYNDNDTLTNNVNSDSDYFNYDNDYLLNKIDSEDYLRLKNAQDVSYFGTPYLEVFIDKLFEDAVYRYNLENNTSYSSYDFRYYVNYLAYTRKYDGFGECSFYGYSVNLALKSEYYSDFILSNKNTFHWINTIDNNNLETGFSVYNYVSAFSGRSSLDGWKLHYKDLLSNDSVDTSQFLSNDYYFEIPKYIDTFTSTARNDSLLDSYNFKRINITYNNNTDTFSNYLVIPIYSNTDIYYQDSTDTFNFDTYKQDLELVINGAKLKYYDSVLQMTHGTSVPIVDTDHEFAPFIIQGVPYESDLNSLLGIIYNELHGVHTIVNGEDLGFTLDTPRYLLNSNYNYKLPDIGKYNDLFIINQDDYDYSSTVDDNVYLTYQLNIELIEVAYPALALDDLQAMIANTVYEVYYHNDSYEDSLELAENSLLFGDGNGNGGIDGLTNGHIKIIDVFNGNTSFSDYFKDVAASTSLFSDSIIINLLTLIVLVFSLVVFLIVLSKIKYIYIVFKYIQIGFKSIFNMFKNLTYRKGVKK